MKTAAAACRRWWACAYFFGLLVVVSVISVFGDQECQPSSVCSVDSDSEGDDVDVDHVVSCNRGQDKDDSSDAASLMSLEDELERAAQFREFAQHLLAKLDDFYYRNVVGVAPVATALTHYDMQQYAVSEWLKYLHMDPAVLTADTVHENWLEQLYCKTQQLAPRVLFSVWHNVDDSQQIIDLEEQPNDFELQVLLALDPSPLKHANWDDATGELVFLDRAALVRQLLVPFRHRGHLPKLLETVYPHMLVPLETVSHAIPSTDNLQLLARYAPLIELGAGTGYWSAAVQSLLLQQQQQQQQPKQDMVLPFDAAPPRPGETVGTTRPNLYFEHTYTTVHQGTCADVFPDDESNNNNKNNNNNTTSTRTAASAAAINTNAATVDLTHHQKNRTLLLVWPNNPDNVDNAPQFHSDVLPPVWDADCVRRYVARGGTTLILVAEREDNIVLARMNNNDDDDAAPPPADSGLSATRKLQDYLKQHFVLVEQQPVLSWYYRDDLTVWRYRGEDDKKTTTTSPNPRPQQQPDAATEVRTPLATASN